MSVHPVPEAARVELERLGARWRTLPLDQALRASPGLRALAQQWADRARAAEGLPALALPDLGPAVAYDQLRVSAYDLAVADPAAAATLADDLAGLRRTL